MWRLRGLAVAMAGGGVAKGWSTVAAVGAAMAAERLAAVVALVPTGETRSYLPIYSSTRVAGNEL